ncbi:MAG: 30S ribosomal protein S1, partial [Pirellulales bacterium]
MTSDPSESASSSLPPASDFTTGKGHSLQAPAPGESAAAFNSPEAPDAPPPAPGAEAAAPSDAPSRGAPKLRIGSQRPGSPKVKARPQVAHAEPPSGKKVEVPNIRERLPIELELEVEEALGDVSLDEMIEPGGGAAPAAELQPESRHRGRIASIHRDKVFVDLGWRNQGLLSLRQFPVAPEVGAVVEVIVTRFDVEEGLYQLALPGAAVDVADWSDLTPGMVVEAKITGHNKGGLECEVNHIRGFIPAGQISLYRVEDLSQFVGESMTCVVTEANAERRNLVLSRRAVLEREKAEAKTKLMSELAVGQVREGVVRSLQDYGAFIDLGGVDGLLHVSQLSWQRVKHPSEVLQVGQAIKVMIRKIDPETGKISLAFRDLSENPWTTAPQK